MLNEFLNARHPTQSNINYQSLNLALGNTEQSSSGRHKPTVATQDYQVLVVVVEVELAHMHSPFHLAIFSSSSYYPVLGA
jgi:hypothetical protein